MATNTDVNSGANLLADQPTAAPPARQTVRDGNAAAARPSASVTPPDAQAIQTARLSAAGAERPAQPLPGMQVVEAALRLAGTTWNNNMTFNALWSINQDRNSWAGVANVGWVKLSTASDTGIQTLSILAAHARQMGSIVNYRQEDDGMIHEMYVW